MTEEQALTIAENIGDSSFPVVVDETGRTVAVVMLYGPAADALAEKVAAALNAVS